MKKLSFTLLLSFVAIFVSAQEKQDTSYWKKGGTAALTFSQTSLSNWSGGGDNAISTNAILDVFANFNKGKNSWENVMKLEYGLVKQGDEGVRKSIDKIDFTSKYGYKNGGHWFYTALLDFKTQFAKGYNYAKNEDESDVKVSNFMAPAYILLSLGMDYKPNETFSAYISPITGKTTVVNDDDLSDAGAFTKLAVNKDIMKNVNFKSTLDLFSNYSETFGNIDVNWDLMINMKVNKFLTASINTTLVYDDDVEYIDDEGMNKGPKIQFKEIVGLGLAYKF
ncbi:DUF3078 domain-containing protein [Labilibaculum sp. DW002]|uniref:DUF3078 domain-containing protein n=1 Tax=Paralabilibaculum antarcticum TaxID=2912572 RepID=A0ABT5VPX9_9BACT|nr:DUF3078 domain-containing protein [Labilibaculum sp. DW002]MDE5417491.1 DUF3078 domain-containing protein [Labilibaculum sp. DW002]